MMLPGKHIHPGTTLDKIKNHLGRHLGSRKTNTLLHNPVICRKNNILGLSQFRGKSLLNQPNLMCRFFKQPQRSLGFRQIINFIYQSFRYRLIGLVYHKTSHTIED